MRIKILVLGAALTAGLVPYASAEPEPGRGVSHARAPFHVGFASTKHLVGMRIVGRHAASPAQALYTIHDIGAPSGSDFNYPSGFNNTGQIFGEVGTYLPQGGSTLDCYSWTGAVFRRLPLPSPAGYAAGCTANGIDDANAAGDYEIVGAASEPFAQDAHAFAAIAGPTGFERLAIYYANGPSTMVGVNASEVAAAAAAFDRDTLYDVQGSLYYTASGATDFLTQLQALPSATSPAVHALVPTYPTPCPFGGCSINARGELLGYDWLTLYDGEATVALGTVGEPASLLHVPLQDVVAAAPSSSIDTAAATYPVAFNDQGQLLYLDAAVNAPAVYDVDTGTNTIIPVSAPGCTSPVPLSMNNRGEVLGTFLNFTTPEYFTWDPAGGTQDLGAELPSSAFTIFPLGVNDNGQILVKLVSGSSVTYWGTLDPFASKAAKGLTKGRRV
jgi:hypothetical protein